ncbi:MAG: bifunctional DNA-formamidopyrimidine glycosylase/DNA-(apurinic or apyrimidinic site) lyase [Aquabacterium sp.]
MPELPEVEVTRRGLAAPLAGARVVSARLGKALRWPLGCPTGALHGLVVGALTRRGKYIWMPLNGQDRHGGLLWHLGMSGSLALLAGPAPPPGPHDHFDLVTSVGLLRLTDPRRFGAVVWSDALDEPPALGLLARLGAEPFDAGFDAAAFRAALKRRRCSIKTAILAGDIIVGAGNIYVAEALFMAGIDPRRRSDRISLARCDRLLQALRQVLANAVVAGGSTLRDFQDAQGHAGAYQDQAQVYGREGQACLRCGGAVRRILQGQRSTFYCPGCQT